MFKKQFGQRLKFLREIEGLTQAQLAEKINVTDRYVSMMERGLSSPSFNVIALVAAALNTEPANLFLFSLGGAKQDGQDRHRASQRRALHWSKLITQTGTCEIDLMKGQTTWSDSFFSILGYAPGQVTPSLSQFTTHIHPDDVETEESNFLHVVSTRKAAQYELRIITVKNDLVFASMRLEANHDSAGIIEKLTLTLSDATDVVHLENALMNMQHKLEARIADKTAQLNALIAELEANAAALRESHQRYSIAEKGANDGIWDWDLRTDRGYFSDRYREILGCTEQDMPNTTEEWIKRIHPEDLARVLETNRLCVEGMVNRLEIEYRMAHKDGSYRWVLGRGASLRGSDGQAQRMAGTLTDITRRKELEASMALMAATDQLTGAKNSRNFREHGCEQVAACKRYGGALTVCVLDIDNFKSINEANGHDAGDEVLKALSGACRTMLRASDVFGRVGGDEFAVLLAHTNAENGLKTAERLRQALADLEVGTLNGPVRFTVSIGVTAYRHHDATFEDVLKRADTALYAAKNNGPDRIAPS